MISSVEQHQCAVVGARWTIWYIWKNHTLPFILAVFNHSDLRGVERRHLDAVDAGPSTRAFSSFPTTTISSVGRRHWALLGAA